jgi:hypothetical protein
VDVPPANNTLNEIICMGSDYILPPTFAERFSAQSTQGLIKDVLPNWFRQRMDYIKYQDKVRIRLDAALEAFTWPKDPPKILPLFVTNYKFQERVGKADPTVTKASTPWIKRLNNIMRKGSISKHLKGHFIPAKSNKGNEQYYIALIGQIQPQLQLCGQNSFDPTHCKRIIIPYLDKDQRGKGRDEGFYKVVGKAAEGYRKFCTALDSTLDSRAGITEDEQTKLSEYLVEVEGITKMMDEIDESDPTVQETATKLAIQDQPQGWINWDHLDVGDRNDYIYRARQQIAKSQYANQASEHSPTKRPRVEEKQVDKPDYNKMLEGIDPKVIIDMLNAQQVKKSKK